MCSERNPIPQFSKHEIELCVHCVIRFSVILKFILYVLYLNLLRFKKRDYQSESSSPAEICK